VQFLRENGIEASMAALEAPLDVHNMSTLMLEKEDLGYRWSFETHADWLEPLQREVLDDPRASVGCVVVVGHGTTDAGEVVVRGDIFDLAAGFAGRMPAGRRPGPLVAYLTDLPPVDDIPRYRELGVEVLVVPFNPVPAELIAAGVDVGIRVVDWARRNAYPTERPQWRLDRRGDDVDLYRRGDRVRVVVSGQDPGARVAELWRSAVTAGADQGPEPTGRWFEVDVKYAPSTGDRPADAGGAVR
jgi:hypothetical protein